MKKFLSALTIIMVLYTVCSCSSNHSEDVFFIHSAIFSKDKNGNLEICAVLEKLSVNDDNADYFTAVETGSSINEITKAISSKYKECYFATCEIYFFDTALSEADLQNIAKSILDSNDYPLKSLACSISETDIKTFCDILKGEKDITNILSILEDSKVNTAHFLSCAYSRMQTELPTLTVKNGKIKKNKETTYFYNGDENEN